VEAIGVAVAHDDASIVRAVGEVLEAAPDLFVAGTSPEAGMVVVAGGDALASMVRSERPVVALAENGSIGTARAAVTIGARDLIRWPDEAELLPGAIRRAFAPASRAEHAAPVIAVVGARGGVGTSAIASLLAIRIAGAVLVDLDPAGGGARAYCRDDDPPTWERLAGLDDVREDVLDAVLVPHGASRALHAPRLAPPPRAAHAMVRAARALGSGVILDCGRGADPVQAEVIAGAEARLLVAADDLASVRGALALKARVGERWLLVVVRGRRMGVPVRDLAAAVGCRPVAMLRWDAALARALDLGRVPPRASRPMRQVARIARALEVSDAR
jgi:Flp pilus assembly CpaE family ATPase